MWMELVVTVEDGDVGVGEETTMWRQRRYGRRRRRCGGGDGDMEETAMWGRERPIGVNGAREETAMWRRRRFREETALD
ncbi:hypothetical protein ACLB2K_006180 [Fragaria x ananassa]